MTTPRRHELSDEKWSRLEPLLPQARRGPRARDQRRILNGIIWLDKTGAPWHDLPERYGSWRTVASQFYRWVRVGVWNQILAQVQQQDDQQGQVDWQTHYVDGSVIRAHQHAAGARRVKEFILGCQPADGAGCWLRWMGS
jgi:transposase